MYNVYEYAGNYLDKPVPESGLGLASPPRLGASPLATQKIYETIIKNHKRIREKSMKIMKKLMKYMKNLRKKFNN